MSMWTHIVGVIHAETFHCCDDIEAYVKEALKNAPPITGSEGPADVFVNAQSGHNMSTSCDCRRCEHKDSLVQYPDGFGCDAPDGYRCPYGQYQTRVVITVLGDLRDRSKAKTRKEWSAFHQYVAKTLGYEIRLATCRIEGV